MVVIFLPAASLSEVWQDRTASPFRCTVQAPQRPAPQPNFVPVICNCSRMTQSSGVSLDASTDIFRPLILRLGIGASPSGVGGRLRRHLTFGYWPAPTGSMPVGAKNDTELSRRQSNLESFEENSVVRCGKALPSTRQSTSSPQAHLPFPHFPTANGSR